MPGPGEQGPHLALCSLWDSLGHYPFTLLLSWGHCLFPRQVVSPYLRAPGPPLDLCFPLWPPLSLNYSVSLCLSAWLLHQHYPLLDPEGVRWLVGVSGLGTIVLPVSTSRLTTPFLVCLSTAPSVFPSPLCLGFPILCSFSRSRLYNYAWTWTLLPPTF